MCACVDQFCVHFPKHDLDLSLCTFFIRPYTIHYIFYTHTHMFLLIVTTIFYDYNEKQGLFHMTYIF